MRPDDEKTLASLLLALAVIAALYFPQLTEILAPYLLHSLFFVMLFSLLPFAQYKSVDLFRVHPMVYRLIIWKQFVLPGALVGTVWLLGIESKYAFYIAVVVTSGSLFASPTIIQLMGLDQRIAVQTVVLSTLAAPVSIYISFTILTGGHVNLALSDFGIRLLIFLAIPMAIFFITRAVVSNWTPGSKLKLERAGRWGSLFALILFCFALENDVNRVLSDQPEIVAKYVLVALGVSLIIGLVTRTVMSSYGDREAMTAAVMASFRNVGLTFGLVSAIGSRDLAVYVGACQIPMFFAPLLFDLFFGKRAFEEKKLPAANQDYHAYSEGQNMPDDTPRGENAHFVAPRAPMPGGEIFQSQGNAALAMQPSALQATVQPAPENVKLVAANPDALYEVIPDREDARALQTLLQRHHESVDQVVANTRRSRQSHFQAARYVACLLAFGILGIAGVWQGNKYFAPMLFDRGLLRDVAEAHIAGKNFGVFDLNINIRDLRYATIARMEKTPEVIVLGASHWQEAHVDLMPGVDFYNSHVHRDYYEDMLAVTEMWVANGRLPKEMIITIRDKLLTPITERTDFLWLPGIKYYRQFAKRIGIEPQNHWDTLPVNTWRELVSMPLLWQHGSRQLAASEQPHATTGRDFEGLDVLLPGGSILWSREHKRMFTQERARAEALAFAEASANTPPQIDPKGIQHLEALFDFLVERGVKVTLAHPQFNPVFWDAVQGTPYMDGLQRIIDQTQYWSQKYGFAVIGGFAPEDVGCTADMYIDAEHGNPTCLGMLLSQYPRKQFEFDLLGTINF